MSRRIDIELTSALDDGTWTWRAAGAKQPKGVLDGDVLPAGAKVGDELKVEVEQHLEGVTVLSVVQGRQKHDRADVIELLPAETEFQPVVETRAKRGRGERGDRDDRRSRRDRRDRGDGEGRGRRDAGGRGDRRDGDRRDRRDRGDGEGRSRNRRDGGRRGPSFTPPPEVPQRPKPKRLRPGKAHRNAVLDNLPAEQRAIAELALQGMPAVRQRLREENERAVAEGRAPMPEASVLKLAEELLPRLRVAEWLDRAEAAKEQMDELDLRDLRSVVAAANDPMVARDDATGPLVAEMQTALVHKQEQELHLWFGDVDAALAVGRVVRALRLSSQPPKAGVPFPSDIAQRLVDSANASLAPMDSPERWIAMLEAAAFSPVRTMIRPARKPDQVNDELIATVTRLAPALPQVAELFEIEVAPDAPMPKPHRPGPRKARAGGKGAKPEGKGKGRGDGRSKNDKATSAEPKAPKAKQKPTADEPTADAPTADEPSDAPTAAAPTADGPTPETTTADEPSAADGPTAEATTADEPSADAPTAAATTADGPTAEATEFDEPSADAPTADEPGAEAPTAEATEIDEPSADEPAADEPGADAPTVAAAETDEPGADAPSADAPSADAPTVAAAEIDEPSADAPSADAPTAAATEIDAPTADAPATDAPASEEAAVGEAAARQTTADESSDIAASDDAPVAASSTTGETDDEPVTDDGA